MIEGPDEVYAFADFQLDVGNRSLERCDGGERILLPEKAFQTLVFLVRNSGALITREAILSAVWADVFVEDGNVGKVIHTIRRALGGGERAFIETVPKHGYRFAADVTQIAKKTADVLPAATTTGAAISSRSPAYDLYIRGKVKADSENPDDTNDAISLLEAATTLDPTSAAAYAQLARAYNTRAFKFTSQADGRVFRENADVALAKALALDPDLAEVHFARGLVLWTKAKGFPHEQAIKSFRKALALDSDADETHHQLSMVYSHVGLLDEALRHVNRAVDLNPNNTMARFRVGVYTAWQCRFEDALAALKSVPSDVSRLLVDRVKAEVYVQLGRIDKARSIVDSYLASHPGDEGGSLTSVRALLFARAGETREAERAIARTIELGTGFGHFHHSAYNIAATYAAIGAADEAVNWLEAAADDGFPCYPYFERDPNLSGLRQHPPFVELMAVLHAQWRRFKEMV